MSLEPQAQIEPSWASLPDEKLLDVRIRDLGISIAGSELEPRIAQLHDELERKGLLFRPLFYLGDEWFSPEGIPAIAIPFYLAHPRLKALEQKMMYEVEGGDPGWCQRLLRHECGHAIDHGFRLHKKKKRHQVFGPRSQEYDPDTYRPKPLSRSFVQHLPNWYAQAHPDEDWAETFAVWLDPDLDWRKRYRGWKALAKLDYMAEVMKEIAGKPAPVEGGKREYEITTIGMTLETYYRRRKKLYATDAPDFYDPDLKRIFSAGAGTEEAETSRRTAAAFLRRQGKQIIDSVSRWTGEHKVTIEHLLKRLTDRAARLELTLAKDEAQTSIEVTAYLATLVTNYRFTGKFKRSV